MAEWIGALIIAPEVEAKLRTKHGLTGDDVKSAVTLGRHDRAAWHHHETYGDRLVVTGSTGDVSLIAYLRPVDRSDGLWECLTAWRLDT